MKHFGSGLRPPLKRHSAVADVFVPGFAATSEMTFGGGRRVCCVLCLLFNLRPKLPSRCVVLGSWSIYFFGCCLVNYCGGLIRWILWLSGSPGKQHHATLVQGLSNWQVWAASPLATFCCIWSSGCRFGSCIPVSSLQYQLIGKLLGGSYFPVGELSQNWSFSFFIYWIK